MAHSIRKLAIVGASTRAAAFSALRAGYEVVAADMFADADLARVAPVTRIENYPEGLADWLATTDCDAWMYTGALENYPDLIDRMAAIKPLAGNSGRPLRDSRDPLKLRALCEEAGVAFPETRSSADDLPHDGSWLCKTYRGASGSGVWRLDDEAALHRAERERAVFQRVVEGQPAAAIYAIGRNNSQLLGVTHQLVGRDEVSPWQYFGSVGPVAVDPRLRNELVSFGYALARTFELRGVVGVDFVIAENRPWIVEMNPRYTASMEILDRHGRSSVVERHAASCDLMTVGSEPAIVEYSAPNRAHAKAIVFSPRTAAILPTFFEWAMTLAAPDDDGPLAADIPHSGEVIRRGHPIMTVFASGDTMDSCIQRLQERIAEVESRPYGFIDVQPFGFVDVP